MGRRRKNEKPKCSFRDRVTDVFDGALDLVAVVFFWWN